MSTDLTARLGEICTALPEATERLSHGAPSWFVRDKKMFATYSRDGHHEEAFPSLWCAAPLGAQEEAIAIDPGKFFRPKYVGHRGWVGVRLDVAIDWDEIADLCENAYRVVAPPKLVALLDEA